MAFQKQVPSYELIFHKQKNNNFCLVIPVINEGERISSLLKKINENNFQSMVDVLIVDGGSTDGSLEIEKLKQLGLHYLIQKTGPGKLSAQLRCAYDFALNLGYEGVITIDGNDKDDPEAIPSFIRKLEEGYDFVQASRFIRGGKAINTPKSRDFAIRFIHAPILSFSSGFHWTDTTQGFRAYSKRLLVDRDVNIFRDIFNGYELLAYLSYIAPIKGFKCTEIPTTRSYPRGEVPSKISAFRGNLEVLTVLFKTVLGCYNEKNKR